MDNAIIIWQVGYVAIIRRNLLSEVEAGDGGDLRVSYFVVFDMVGNMLFDMGYMSVVRCQNECFI